MKSIIKESLITIFVFAVIISILFEFIGIIIPWYIGLSFMILILLISWSIELND